MEAGWTGKGGVEIEECVIGGKVMAVIDSRYVVEIGVLEEWEAISVLLIFVEIGMAIRKRT